MWVGNDTIDQDRAALSGGGPFDFALGSADLSRAEVLVMGGRVTRARASRASFRDSL